MTTRGRTSPPRIASRLFAVGAALLFLLVAGAALATLSRSGEPGQVQADSAPSADGSAAAPTTGAAAGPESGPADPDLLGLCTAELFTTEQSAHPSQPDRATVDCQGRDPVTLGGDFREGSPNVYDPVEAHGVERIEVISGQTRAEVQDSEHGTCMIATTNAAAPVACKTTTQHT